MNRQTKCVADLGTSTEVMEELCDVGHHSKLIRRRSNFICIQHLRNMQLLLGNSERKIQIVNRICLQGGIKNQVHVLMM